MLYPGGITEISPGSAALGLRSAGPSRQRPVLFFVSRVFAPAHGLLVSRVFALAPGSAARTCVANSSFTTPFAKPSGTCHPIKASRKADS